MNKFEINTPYTVTVTKVFKSDSSDKYPGHNVIVFNTQWAVPDDVMQDFNNKNHEIKLKEQYKGKGTFKYDEDTWFYFEGEAKIGERYYVKHHQHG